MGFCDIVYNKETGAIFTRTPASWAKIGLFYLVYYTCLAVFFAGLLAIFLYAFTDDKAPLLTGSHSVLPQNPGMGFRPRPIEDKTLIKYSLSDPKSYQPFINDMNTFLNPNGTANTYMKGQSEQDYADCSKGAAHPYTYASKPCQFRVDQMASVKKACLDNNFGYEDGTPCFTVKLNKIFEFVPQLIEGGGDYLKIECMGEHTADLDNAGPFEYYPKNGVDLAFFPFVGQKGYISPLVFVKMTKPVTGVLIQIVCKPVNAANIVQNKQSNGDGRVTLELMIDP